MEEGAFKDLTIVGIIKDYVYGNMYGSPGPVIFFCMPPKDANLVYVRTKQDHDPGHALAKIESVIKKDNAAYPFEYKFVDDQFNKMFVNEILVSKISGLFAALTIIISCFGLVWPRGIHGRAQDKRDRHT